MFIKRLQVKNFRSIKELDLELNNLNIFIGANASGKTNTIKIFEFLKLIIKHGLENAISKMGGGKYLKNLKSSKSENLEIKIIFDVKERIPHKEKTSSTFSSLAYNFELEINDKDFKIIEDKIAIGIILDEYIKNNIVSENQKNKQIKIILSQNNGCFEINFSPPLKNFAKKEIEENPIINLFKLINESFLDRNKPYIPISFEKLLLEYNIIQTIYTNKVKEILNEIAIYNFEPNILKESTKSIGLSELEENGENLSIVLKKLLSDKEKERMFKNLVQNILPFINDLNVESSMNNSLLVKMQEQYDEEYLPSFLLSDGTINITALIIVLYFEKNKFIIIEEPERNIHPSLITDVVDMLKDASGKKQIIVTTHNPEIVKHADLDDILLVSRDEDGFSHITKPAEKDDVKIFLENEMKIDELFIQNLLEV